MAETLGNSLRLELRPGVTVAVCCRGCGDEQLVAVLDLGEQVVGNAFHQSIDDESPSAPLRLMRCSGCSLVQLAHTVDPDVMYAAYWYRSGVNNTMRSHLTALAEQACQLVDLREDDVVIDIGCNDGTLLAAVPEIACRVGVDPSDIRPQSCDAFVNSYFSAEAVAEHLGQRRAKIITSIAMFYDLDDPRAFVRDVEACLADEGVWVAELSYLPSMLKAVSYDTICHEHVSYYRLATFESVLVDSGLRVFDVEFNSCNGGSFRLFIAKTGQRRPSERLSRARVLESRLLLDTDYPYRGFIHRVVIARAQLRRFLGAARSTGSSVYGYGASTKGNVTLQYCDVSPDDLVAIAERNPSKYGRFTPGTKIPICSEAQMREQRPDYLLVLPWHFIDEFLERERPYLESGGKLVVPLPEFRIYDAEG